ncbi:MULTISPECIES: betaine/proline/choline family ABC transporter ATP-binding protein [Lactobacillus]|uniref:Quaternary amine transport ATP-binding protein n=1 Tax=Lactobacillus melliventris TaxID=1218507 RepID=A0A0F4LFS0_9LACO|nr:MULTISPECIES: ABC transporter ATP-binding protein [Lactobacillus]KJY57104.1 ABC transporter, Glycine betaine/L-proline transporter ATPase component [Lactobacillus melliventris]MBH9989938.1 ABC transporter ATP-binding protein [Lactobacillus sp. M0392]MBI0024402.1 ABC transporter ATP-binding protein [Lactobacillus sp. W8171]MBI0045044.1 ABC transporter ATP-binding protein [Lactobacillus sp. M0393]PXY84251.1 ABC transporter ATP-binding protein [Lactobacillus melliventris]
MGEKIPMVEFKDVSKIYPKMKNPAVNHISFEIDKGDFCCLIGTSGSGKTTLMRMINRMNSVTKGEVLVNGKNVKSFNPVNLRRHIGYVIQNNGLMPHMTIRENIILVPKLLKWPKEKLAGEAQKLIQMAELPESYLDRYPTELSGGQQQRIGVVRALAANQNLILMDEPFGALDPITRESLQNLVQNLQVRLGKTIVFVTHDMDEALKLATKVVVLHDGQLIQVGTPEEILHHPANDYVKSLIGEERLSEAKYETVKVKNVMLTNPIKIDLGASLSDALTMMKENRVDTLLVVDNSDHLKGYISIDDLQRNYSKASSVSDILITKVSTVGPDEYLRDNFSRIMSRNKSYIPVIDSDNKLVGIVTRASLVNVVYQKIWGDKGHTQNNTGKEAN